MLAFHLEKYVLVIKFIFYHQILNPGIKITKSEEILNLGIKIAKLKKSQIRGNKKPRIKKPYSQDKNHKI